MKDKVLEKAIQQTIENLETIDYLLNRCVNQGMIDEGSRYHNELVDLQTDAEILTSWEELQELITQAKTREVDIDAWISMRGGSTLGLEWPHKETE